MKPKRFVTFDGTAAKFVAESLGLKVRGVRIYRKYPGLPVVCQTCGKVMTVKNVGSFAKGKTVTVELYCDNPVCLIAWATQNKVGYRPKPRKS